MKNLTFAFVLVCCKAFSCTAFFINSSTGKVFAKNFDWLSAKGQLVQNNRGVSKKALIANGDQAKSWVSKYGSISFNQYGVEFPLGGMNEKGLVVEMLWLDEAKYLPKDSRFCVNELQWVQYQLDVSSSVSNVIESLNSVRISDAHSNVHFMIADKSGDYAIIEFVNGQQTIHHKPNYPILANNAYADEMNYLKTHQGFGGTQKPKKTSFSKDRFVTTCSLMKNVPSSNVQDFAFATLKDVSSSGTVWSLVYDLNKLSVTFLTESNQAKRTVNLSDLNFSCSPFAMTYNLDTKNSGKISMSKSTVQDNARLIDEAIEEVEFLADIPEEYIDRVKKYPSTVGCK